MATTPFTLAALAAEIRDDPTAAGYAAHVASGDHGAIAALLNAANGTAYLRATTPQVLRWGAATGVRYSVEAAATATGPFAANQSKAISAADQGIALAIRDLLTGGYGTLDLTDASIAGATSTGDPYTPGGSVATPGLLDALVSAGILVDGGGASLKDALMALGRVAASRATTLWGYSFAGNPTGPDAVTVTTDQIAAALRG